MEENINIAEILKNKPEKTILYDAMRDINVSLYVVEKQNGETNIFCDGMEKFKGCSFVYSDTGADYIFRKGMQLLKPSKEMQDWDKFSWKRGDVLISDCGFVCIFKEWASDDYTRFNGCYFDGMPNAQTAKYSKLDNNTAYGYIRELEKRCGGVLNIKTLKIEKQPEFKDGDIITFKDRIIIIYNTSIEKSPERTEIYYHACLKEGVLTVNEYLMSCGFGEGWYSSTEEEKHNLFEALAKKCKRWDSEKKQIVDFKPNDEIKPFGKVLVRDGKDEIWEPAFFFRYLSQFSGYNYQTVGGEWRVYCIPYIGNESLLGTTKDMEG